MKIKTSCFDTASSQRPPTVAELHALSSWSEGPVSADAVWEDMRMRFLRGERPLAEDYLPDPPDSVADDIVIDLAYAEYVLRRQAGEVPKIDDFLLRFPNLAEPLRKQLEFHAEFDEAHFSAPHEPGVRNETRFPAEPQRFGKYTILAGLDSGGQADVYRAIHPELARQVVLKIARNSMAGDAAARRLIEEGRLLAELDHPNIARVHDLGVDNGRPYLVMEFIRGGTLQRYAKDHVLDPRQSAAIVASVARGVAAAHKLQIAHLDIKPQNILIDEQGLPRLIDFGLCRLPDAWTSKPEIREMSGTLQYMSPEQFNDAEAIVGLRSDIFALGGVLYYLLTGQPPYSGSLSQELLDRVRQGAWDGEPLARAGVPSALRAICHRAMAVDPVQRFASADDLARALDAYERRFARRRFLVAGAALAVGFAAITWRQLAASRPASTSIDVPTLSARVWQAGKFAPLKDILPLVSGDQVQVQAQIPAGMHASLFAFSADGKLERLMEWAASDVGHLVQFPSKIGATVPLQGPRGTEMLILCCDSVRAPTREMVCESVEFGEPLPTISRHALGHVSPQEVIIESSSKGFGAPVGHDDPDELLRTRLARIRGRLEQQFPAFRCLAFPHQ